MRFTAASVRERTKWKRKENDDCKSQNNHFIAFITLSPFILRQPRRSLNTHAHTYTVIFALCLLRFITFDRLALAHSPPMMTHKSVFLLFTNSSVIKLNFNILYIINWHCVNCSPLFFLLLFSCLSSSLALLLLLLSFVCLPFRYVLFDEWLHYSARAKHKYYCIYLNAVGGVVCNCNHVLARTHTHPHDDGSNKHKSDVFIHVKQ